jgi:hypothetical protein
MPTHDVTSGAHAAERIAKRLREKAGPPQAKHPKGRQPGRVPRGVKPSPGLSKLSAAEKGIRGAGKRAAATLAAKGAAKILGAAGAVYGAYQAGKAVGEAMVKRAEKHHTKTIAHTRKHYGTPEQAAATRRAKTGK